MKWQIGCVRPLVRACTLAGLALAGFLWTPPNAQAMIITYNYVGADQSFVVPTNVTSINFEIWGAGGGDGGGSGGFSGGLLAVTPLEVLVLDVGGGGASASGVTGQAYGGGGHGSNPSGISGGGGGASEIRHGSTPLAIAGGGGGGVSTSIFGGAGGGLIGGSGSGAGGHGGTQSAGGAAGGAGANAGIQLIGGSAVSSLGGGGGGGWYGGGAGGTTSLFGGGGGGSSYIGPGVSFANTLAGSLGTAAGVAAADSGAADYLSGIGVGGATGASGGNGLFVISYAGPVTVPEPGTVLLLGSGLVGLVGMGVRRAKRRRG
jgi:hypothetical protein